MLNYSTFLLILVIFANFSWLKAETIALALSGGGARGFAHIGVLKALEEEGIEPDLIVGSSIGAVVGGLYAAGYSVAEIEQIAEKTDWSALFLERQTRRNLFLGQKETTGRYILSLRFRNYVPEVPLALSNGQKLSEQIFELVHRAPYAPWESFDDLKIPFRAVATDLISGKAVVFREGDLAEALRASCSMPLLFTPYKLDSLQLVDGGVSENIPVGIAKQEGGKFIIAVDMTTELGANETLLPWELADRVSTILHLEKKATSLATADLVITPDIGAHKATDFTGTDAMIQKGYEETKKIIAENRDRIPQNKTLKKSSGICYGTRGLLREDSLRYNQYQFEGITKLTALQLNSLPVGINGNEKLSFVRRTYLDDDYSLAHATKVELNSNGTLESRWEEGKILSIAVSGLRRYNSKTLLREFPLREGSVFDLRRAKRGIEQIYGSDLFDQVFLSVLPTDSGAHLTIRAQERSSPLLRLGASYSSERKGRGFAEFLNDNVLNTGGRFTLFGKYGERDEELYGKIGYDRVMNTYMTTELKLGWKRTENNFYDSQHDPIAFYFFERHVAELWAGQAFRRWGQVAGGILHDKIRSGGVYNEPSVPTTRLSIRSIVDTKDSYPFPEKGIQFRGQYEYAIKDWSNDLVYNRITLMADASLPIAKRWVLRGRTDYGWNDRILPLWGRHFMGGAESLLGLHEYEKYGNVKHTIFAELRYDLLSKFLADAYFSALYSVGGVSINSDLFPAAENYRQGIGICFALSTFLGPIKLTASELLRSNYQNDQFRLYVNLGHDF